MALFTKSNDSLNDLFVRGLQSAYYMEKEIVDALPTMIETAASQELKQALSNHLQETKDQVKRIMNVFELHGVGVKTGSCPAIDGILKEAKSIASDTQQKAIDAAIISSAQKVEHYEISSYGTLISWAKALGRDDCADVLEKNLQEEKAADARLTKLAEEGINRMAA